MKETFKESKNWRRSTLLTGLASTLAIAGCGIDDKESGEWKFAVTCPAESDLNVGNISNTYKSTVEISCGTESQDVAPLSIELVEGAGLKIEDQTDGFAPQMLEIGYEYRTNLSNPVVSEMNINEVDGNALITLGGVDLTKVSVD